MKSRARGYVERSDSFYPKRYVAASMSITLARASNCEYPPGWSARRRAAEDTARSGGPSCRGTRLQCSLKIDGYRRQRARRFQHGQAADGRARAVESRHLGRPAFPNRGKKSRQLLRVAFFGPNAGAAAARTGADAEPLEVFREHAQPLREDLHALAARSLAAGRGVRQISSG